MVMIYTRIKTEKVTMKDLFSRLEVEDKASVAKEVPFNLKVKTPYGYNKIRTVFRTELQETITSYFKNNKTLKTSNHHLVKVNGEWKKSKDLTFDDIVETDSSTTSLSRVHRGTRKESLYDISVEDVHCYYSNGILSHNSWLLARLGTEAIKQKKNVMHFTLELAENYVGLRYDSCFTGINFQDVRDHVDVVKQKLNNPEYGKLFIQQFPIKTVNAQSLKMFIERIQMLKGIKIDMAVIDYADLLAPAMSMKNSNSYSEAGSVYEELRTMAGELRIPVWSASQSHRCHFVNDLVDTPNGKVKIGNIKVGDQVLTHRGYKKVKTVFKIENQPVYRIKTKTGKEINISSDHMVPTKCGKLKSLQSGLSVGDTVFIKK